MAKTKMQCLFSGNLCRECALYRARHYYLCFRNDYRGRRGKPGEVSDTIAPPTPGSSRNQKSELPYNKLKNAIDPQAIINKEREEEIKNVC